MYGELSVESPNGCGQLRVGAEVQHPGFLEGFAQARRRVETGVEARHVRTARRRPHVAQIRLRGQGLVSLRLPLLLNQLDVRDFVHDLISHRGRAAVRVLPLRRVGRDQRRLREVEHVLSTGDFDAVRPSVAIGDAVDAHHHLAEVVVRPGQLEHVANRQVLRRPVRVDGTRGPLRGEGLEVTLRDPGGNGGVHKSRVLDGGPDSDALHLLKRDVLGGHARVPPGIHVPVVDRDRVRQLPEGRAREVLDLVNIVFVQVKQVVLVVSSADQLQSEQAGLAVHVQGRVDMLHNLPDEVLNRGLAVPEDADAHPLVVELVRRGHEGLVIHLRVRVAHAPIGVGQALPDDVGRVHGGAVAHHREEHRVVQGVGLRGVNHRDTVLRRVLDQRDVGGV